MDYQTIIDALHAKGARGDCSICGKNEWFSLGGPDEVQTFVLATEKPDERTFDPGYGLGAMGWACGNCGFIRLHVLEVIASKGLPSGASQQH